jgi:hypothetical protein
VEPGHPSLFLVYDFMDGGDLGAVIASGAPLAGWERVKVGARCRSLAKAGEECRAGCLPLRAAALRRFGMHNVLKGMMPSQD